MKVTTVLLAVLGIGILSVMDAMIKGLSPRYPTVELAFMRFAVGTLVASAFLAGSIVARGGGGWPTRESLVGNGVRAIFIALTATTFFHALAQLPMAEAFALSFLSPIFLALLGVTLLGERAGPKTIVALAIGFVGMLVIVSGHGGGGGSGNDGARSLSGVAAALISAVTYALSMVLLRARARHDSVTTIVFFQHFFPTLLLTAPAYWVWKDISVADYPAFALTGALGCIGHLLLAHAFARAEAARLAPLEYTCLVWGVGLGFFAFGEVPALQTVCGAALIVAGAVISSRRERVVPL